MALNVSSTQIYAGRYHHQNMEIPDILHKATGEDTKEIQKVKDILPFDTVTFSDEGLAKSKNWREYTKDNENISRINFEERINEFNKELHTVNNIDTSSMFNCELSDVVSEIKEQHNITGKYDSFEEYMTVMAKSYQVIYDRIQEDFATPDRETTYIKQQDGSLREEVIEDRIAALNKAYNSRMELAISSAKVQAQISRTFGGKNYSDDFIEEIGQKMKETWENAISEQNLERLRKKVASISDYQLDFGIEKKWINVINELRKRN